MIPNWNMCVLLCDAEKLVGVVWAICCFRNSQITFICIMLVNHVMGSCVRSLSFAVLYSAVTI